MKYRCLIIVLSFLCGSLCHTQNIAFYQYSPEGWLKQSSNGSTTTTYSYDALGNRLGILKSGNGTLPDLVVTNQGVSPATEYAGATISVSCRVSNQDSVATLNTSRVGYYLSSDNTYDGSDVFLGSDSFSILNFGQFEDLSTTVTIPINTQSGNFYIFFFADDLFDVAENNENNNIVAQNITILGNAPLPVAELIASSQTIVTGSSVQFIDQSSNNPTSWVWSFPGGVPSSSTLQNPIITYNTNGTYDVSLTATNADGSDTETKTNYITVGACSETWDFVGANGFSVGGVEDIEIEIDNNGVPYVAFKDYSNSNMATVMKFDGTSWVLVGNAGFSGVAVDYLDLEIANNNMPYVAYKQLGGTKKVTVKRFTGTSWVNIGSPNFTLEVTGNPSLALTSTNQPFVAVQETSNSNRIAVMKFHNSTWVYAGSPGVSNGGVGTVVQSLEIDDNDDVYLAYEDVTNSQKIAVKKYDGGSQWDYVGSSGVSAGAASYPSLDFGVTDIPYLAYNDELNNNKTTVRRFTNGVWNDVGAVGFGPGTGSSYQKMVVSNSLEPYVSFRYGSSQTSVMKFQSGNWINVGVANFPNVPASYQGMAIDNNDVPYLVYRSTSNSNKATVLKYECDTSIIANFFANNTIGTVTDSFNLIDASVNSPTDWEWSFSPNYVTYINSTNSFSQYPEITFDSTGLYSVTLIASNSNSADSVTKTDCIEIVSTHTITTSVTGNGTVSLFPNGGVYQYGDSVIVSSTPDIGWQFDGWSGDLSGSNNTELVYIDSDKSITANFSQIDYVLNVNIIGNGTVNLQPNNTTYHYGDVVDLTAIPDVDWQFDNWSGDISGSNGSNSVVIDGNKSVTANFSEVTNQYTLTLDTIGNGNIDLSPSGGIYNDGEVVTLTATPDIGWQFDNWSDDLNGNTNPVTIVMDANKVVTANFSQELFIVSVNIVGSGTIDLNPPGGAYVQNTVVTLTANPDLDWLFIEWSGDLNGNTNPVTIVVDTNKTIGATFNFANSISNPSIDNLISISPNPTNNKLFIFASGKIEVTSIIVFDILGKKLLVFDEMRKIISLEKFPPAEYFLRIETDKGVINKKIIKSN